MLPEHVDVPMPTQIGEVIRLTSIEPRKNRFRFYTLSWQRDLFGGVALVRTYGRLGTSGRTRITSFAD